MNLNPVDCIREIQVNQRHTFIPGLKDEGVASMFQGESSCTRFISSSSSKVKMNVDSPMASIDRDLRKCQALLRVSRTMSFEIVRRECTLPAR
jgi:hypothetical protein